MTLSDVLSLLNPLNLIRSVASFVYNLLPSIDPANSRFSFLAEAFSVAHRAADNMVHHDAGLSEEDEDEELESSSELSSEEADDDEEEECSSEHRSKTQGEGCDSEEESGAVLSSSERDSEGSDCDEEEDFIEESAEEREAALQAQLLETAKMEMARAEAEGRIEMSSSEDEGSQLDADQPPFTQVPLKSSESSEEADAGRQPDFRRLADILTQPPQPQGGTSILSLPQGLSAEDLRRSGGDYRLGEPAGDDFRSEMGVITFQGPGAAAPSPETNSGVNAAPKDEQKPKKPSIRL